MNKKKRIVPTFATEAEEEEWWFRNRSIHGRDLQAAVKSGEAKVLTKEKLLDQIAASRKPSAKCGIAACQHQQEGDSSPARVVVM